MNKEQQVSQHISNELVSGSAGRNGSGFLVETKLGAGRTYHNEKAINNKIPVFLNDGRKVLCSSENIKIIGFID